MLLRIALLLIVCYSVSASDSSCPSGWTEFENYCYRYFGFKKSWNDANVFCGYVGSLGYSSSAPYYRRSDLTSILNQREQQFLKDYWTSSNTDQEATWIGLNDVLRNRVFRWTDGSSLDYENWNPGEPNNFKNKGEYYGSMYRNGRWNDDHASSEKQFGFICKMRRTT